MLTRWFSTVCLALLIIALAPHGASAQFLERKTLSLDAAKKMAAAAEAEAAKNKWTMAIAVLDDGGHLIYLERMDGTQIGSIEVAQGKARTAARFRRETRVFYNAFEGGHSYIGAIDPTLVASPGGFPLVEGGKLIGAVGCSGGTGDQDAVVCKVAAEVVK